MAPSESFEKVWWREFKESGSEWKGPQILGTALFNTIEPILCARWAETAACEGMEERSQANESKGAAAAHGSPWLLTKHNSKL